MLAWHSVISQAQGTKVIRRIEQRAENCVPGIKSKAEKDSLGFLSSFIIAGIFHFKAATFKEK